MSSYNRPNYSLYEFNFPRYKNEKEGYINFLINERENYLRLKHLLSHEQLNELQSIEREIEWLTNHE